MRGRCLAHRSSHARKIVEENSASHVVTTTLGRERVAANNRPPEQPGRTAHILNSSTRKAHQQGTGPRHQTTEQATAAPSTNRGRGQRDPGRVNVHTLMQTPLARGYACPRCDSNCIPAPENTGNSRKQAESGPIRPTYGQVPQPECAQCARPHLPPCLPMQPSSSLIQNLSCAFSPLALPRAAGSLRHPTSANGDCTKATRG
jgi:hypothetical protein